MNTRTPLRLGLLLLAGLLVACAPAADFKGGATPPTDTAPTDAPEDTAEVTPGEVSPDTAAATCTTDEECQAAWKDQVFPCHAPACGASGACEWQAVADAEACDDGNDCTENDACLDGQCVGDPRICDAGSDPCVSAACVRGQGCQPVNTQAWCDDGDRCTVNDACADGTCKAGQAIVCDDANPCTSDACDAGACVFTPKEGACDDLNPCTTGDACLGGACAPGGWSTCDELQDVPCQRKVCVPPDGCTLIDDDDGAPCDDLDACTLGDTCLAGSCAGPVPTPCRDDDPCTTDGCDPSSGCTFQPIAENGACDDLNPCTSGEKCKSGLCKGGTVASCPDDGDPCTLDACDPATGSCGATVIAGLPCDDKNPCTQADTCDQAGQCKGGPGVPCNDGNPCTTDLCTVVNGAAVCSATPGLSAAACDDKNPCTTNDACQPGKTTCAGAPKSCNDGNPCTVDSCNYVDGACLHTDAADGTACESEDLCLKNPRCTAGACVGDVVSCDDGDLCTADLCDKDGGCYHQPATHTPDEAGCLSQGVCAGKATVTCAPTALTCDYAAAVGFEAAGEVSCDGLDNDCDGLIDEALCGVCSAGQRVCAGNDVLICNDTGYGWEPDRTCAAGSTCTGAGACLPDAAAVVAADADPDPARSHSLAVDADGRLLVALPVLAAGQAAVTLKRVLPDTLEAVDVATLGDVKVLTIASTDDRRLHVVYQAATGANLDLHVLTVQGAAASGDAAQPVQGFQAVAAPLVLDGFTLAVPVATINVDTTELQTLQFDVASKTTDVLGRLAYSGYLIKRLGAARQVDGDLALLYSTNTQRHFLTRFAFATGALLEPVELQNDPEPVGVAAPETAAFAAVLEQDALGTVSVTTYALAAFAEKGTGYLGATSTANGRVRAWGRGQQVLVAWDGGTPAAPLVGSSLVDDAGLVTSGPIPATLEGFDARWGHSDLGFEWVSWRTATGELHFLKL